jgi:hypothetical protein
MMGVVTGSGFEVDVVAFVERLAERLRQDGVAHPVAAAVALAARGRRRSDPDAFAGELGIEPGLVRRAEAGEVAFAELPDELTDWLDPVQLLQVAELARSSPAG